jgi:hypothetical protein
VAPAHSSPARPARTTDILVCTVILAGALKREQDQRHDTPTASHASWVSSEKALRTASGMASPRPHT